MEVAMLSRLGIVARRSTLKLSKVDGTPAAETSRRKTSSTALYRCLNTKEDDKQLIQNPMWSVKRQLGAKDGENTLSDEKLTHIADLSLISVEEDQVFKGKLKKDLSSILKAAHGVNKYVAETNDEDTSSSTHLHDSHRQVHELRDDVVNEQEELGEELLNLSNSREGRYYAVPR